MRVCTVCLCTERVSFAGGRGIDEEILSSYTCSSKATKTQR